jgi:hypothetical protein
VPGTLGRDTRADAKPLTPNSTELVAGGPSSAAGRGGKGWDRDGTHRFTEKIPANLAIAPTCQQIVGESRGTWTRNGTGLNCTGRDGTGRAGIGTSKRDGAAIGTG